MRAAIAGCGGIAHVHAAVLDAMPDVDLVAFADIIPERAEEFQGKYGGNIYDSIDKMLDAEKPDVLHICLPHYLHVPVALDALKRGINVFMEKPPVISAEQFAELKAYSGSAKLGVCFQNRYNPCSREAKRLIESGEAGKVIGCRGFVTWNRGQDYYLKSGWRGKLATEGGGVLINQSVHTMDLMTWIAGKPEAVSATITNHHLRDVIEVEDMMEACITYEGGAKGIFYATTAYSLDSKPIIEFACENMTIRMEDPTLTIIRKDGTVEVPEFEKTAALGKGYWGAGHGACIRDYYDSLAEGRTFMNELPGILDTTKLMLGMYTSAREGHDVAID